MKKNLAVIGGLVALLVLLLVPQNTFAHVLLMDTTNSVGAILHIMPDDDPIAGEESDMYFDRQDVANTGDATVRLSVRDSLGEETAVDVKTTGGLSTATYTFPAQGVYELTFTAKTEAGEYIFKQSQRVTRGVVSTGFNAPKYYWSEALLVGTSVGFVALGIVAFNQRKEIAKQSTF